MELDFPIHYYSDKNKPPQPNKWLKRLCIALAIFIILYALHGCSFDKKLSKWNPQTTKDSLTLANKSSQVFPVPPPIYKEGKPVVITHIVHDTTKQKEIVSQVDTIISHSGCPNKDSLIDAVLRGVGTFNDSTQIDSVFKTDTIYQTPKETNVQLNDLRLQNVTLSNQHISDTTTISDKTKYLWDSIALNILLLIGGTFAVTKALQKKANILG